MKVKKYQADDMQQAVLKVKSDLGSDAIILHTRKFKTGGFFGFFAKEQVEVLATREEKVEQQPKKRSSNQEKREELKEQIQQTAVAESSNDEVKEELKQMKSLFNDMLGEMKEERKNRKLSSNSDFQAFVNDIWSLGVSNQTATDLADKVLSKVERSDGVEVKDLLKEEFRKELNKIEPIKLNSDGPKVIAFVGPTGVGKTTTLAKLAARFSLFKDKKVGLITADTYRIAAAKQLENYSEIMGLPLKVTYTPEELTEAINAYQDYDLILVDTAGRSRNDQLHMSELKGFLNKAEIDEVFLVVSATTKTTDLLDTIDVYSNLQLDKLIITKIDETNSLGVLFEVAKRSAKPISYITTGQDVPEDIELPDPEQLVEDIVKGLNL